MRQRRMSMIAATCIGLAGVLPAPALAQDERDRVQTLLPQRHLHHPRWESQARVTRVDAEISIHGRVATTSLAITLHNPGSRQVEAELVLPVPNASAVRSFSLDGLGGEGGARLLPREEATRIYRDIVRRMIDPGLLEFAGYGLIKSSVFPVPAGGTQTFRVTYEQVLSGDGPRVDYVLPRSESLEDSGVEWSVSVRVKQAEGGSRLGAVYSPSHEVGVKPMGPDGYSVSVAPSALKEPGSFRLSYILASEDAIPMTVMAYPDASVGDGSGGYFMIVAGAGTDVDRPTIKREVTIVIDRSGSMRGEKIEQAKNAALQIIESLDEGERFNIISYSDTIERFAPAPVEKNRKSVGEARDVIGAIQAVGGTNIHDALLEAVRPEPAEGTLPLVLFLTDGLATVGVTGEHEIREAVGSANGHERRIFTFGVGFDVNAPLLSALARHTRGASTFVLPDEDVEVKVGQVFRKLQGPVLASPRLRWNDATASGGMHRIRQVLPAELPDLFAGERFVILGEYSGSRPMSFHLMGEGGNGAPRGSIELNPASASVANSFVPRLWAQRKIASMIEQIRLSGDAASVREELVAEIVRLSLKHGILTEYTAFLAAEEGEFARAGALRGESLARAEAEAVTALEDRAVRTRAGRGAVNQSMNMKSMSGEGGYGAAPAARQTYYDADMNEVEISSVQNIADRTLLRRQGRWVDARILEHEAEDPDETIEFGTDAYFELSERLARENRQGLIAQRGEVYLLVDGRRVLVQNPG